MPKGRPTSYKEEYCKLAEQFCLLGATNEQLADFFDVNVDTIHEWKKVHPDFSDAIKRGKEIADAEIAQALYHRAKGYSHKDVDIKQFQGEIIETPIIKYYPPDTAACYIWLKNRQPAKWREKQEIINHNRAIVVGSQEDKDLLDSI